MIKPKGALALVVLMCPIPCQCARVRLLRRGAAAGDMFGDRRVDCSYGETGVLAKDLYREWTSGTARRPRQGGSDSVREEVSARLWGHRSRCAYCTTPHPAWCVFATVFPSASYGLVSDRTRSA
jgi:hypothetical protein